MKTFLANFLACQPRSSSGRWQRSLPLDAQLQRSVKRVARGYVAMFVGFGEFSVVEAGSHCHFSPPLLAAKHLKCGASAGIHTYKVDQQRGGANL